MGSSLALATACAPTAKGSVSAALSVGRPFGTARISASLSSIRSAKPPGRRLEKPSASTPPACMVIGTLTTRAPVFSARAEPGPKSRISAQNSWPNTVSAAGSKPLSGAPARRVRSIMCSMWCRACRSDPQIPQASVLTSTWPSAGTRSATSSQTSALLRRTTALMGSSYWRSCRRRFYPLTLAARNHHGRVLP